MRTLLHLGQLLHLGLQQLSAGSLAQVAEHYTGSQRSWVKIPYRPEFFSGVTFTTAEVVFITSKIAFIFNNLFLLRETIFEKLWPIETIKNQPKSSQTR